MDAPRRALGLTRLQICALLALGAPSVLLLADTEHNAWQAK